MAVNEMTIRFLECAGNERFVQCAWMRRRYAHAMHVMKNIAAECCGNALQQRTMRKILSSSRAREEADATCMRVTFEIPFH
ncbi:MAG: hypothetical protein JOZ74_13230 [Bradyrhizobium sp.]|nr:hypothetical protein [Bradyrhizobium sp.]